MKSSPTRENSRETQHAGSRKQRRYRRFALDARIAILRTGHRRPYHGRTLGISEAGISAVLAADLDLSESVSLEFALPSSPQSMAVRAVVRNRSGARYGFEFLTLSAEQRTAINSFCDFQNG